MSCDEMVQEVSRALSLMRKTLANAPKLDAELIEIWVLVLSRAGLTPKEVRDASEIVIGEAKFFPQPSVFIEAIRPRIAADTKAEGAWQQLLTCLRQFGGNGSLTAADLRGDGAALWALNRVGWERMSEEMGDDNRHWFRDEFVRVYRLAVTEGFSLAYLPGRFERSNVAGGFALNPGYCGRTDWAELPADRSMLAEQSSDELESVPAALPALAAAIGRPMPEAQDA